MADPAAAPSTPNGGSQMYGLTSELVGEILSRLDGTTLARAACACTEFGRIGREDALWEDACGSFCPSDPLLRHFISSSFGGFRKFYGHSFPFVLPKLDGHDSRQSPHTSDRGGPRPSDWVSIVDVRYRQKSMYSEVLWGIPDAGDLHGWFSNCPFRIDLLTCASSEGEEDGADSPAVAADANGLPSVPVRCTDEEGRAEKFWRGEIAENMRVSWIFVDRRTKRAVNVSSGRPLELQRHLWDSNGGFVLRFGSILPPAVHCVIVMKCRICGGDGEFSKLKICELGLQLEDLAGGHVDGKNSLLALERALGCRRTARRSEALECFHQYSQARSRLRQEKTRREGRLDTICLLVGIAAFAVFCYAIIRG